MVLQAVSAMAVSPWAQYPPRMAVAMRANKRNARVMVYEVLVGADAGSPFGSSALCVSQANIAESLTIKVVTPSASACPAPLCLLYATMQCHCSPTSDAMRICTDLKGCCTEVLW